MADLTRQQLDTLGKIQTCAVANAIETFDVMPRSQGFMRPAVRSIFPGLGSMIGYAVTGVISGSSTGEGVGVGDGPGLEPPPLQARTARATTAKRAGIR